ncbi:MAG: hypothetical protein NVS9B10_24620 [Nevskia sp.]
MPEFMLFRARPAFGPLHRWNESHLEAIGRVEVVTAAIRNLFASPLRWSRYDETRTIFALGDDDGRCVDLMYSASAGGEVDFIVARKAEGATLVRLVEMLELNFVFDPERAAYLDPYRCDARGNAFVAKGVYELTAERRPPA